ncbi:MULTISPECIES: hypothetical protein [unclassified Nonomuraea]|nr:MULTISPECIES: hypothetical protein [unclassified Nonomuraea]
MARRPAIMTPAGSLAGVIAWGANTTRYARWSTHPAIAERVDRLT